MTVSTDTILLIAALRTIADQPSTNTQTWLIRTRQDQWGITSDPGVKAMAVWSISRAELGTLLWDHHSVLLPLPDAIRDPDQAVRVASVVRSALAEAL